MKKLRDMKKSAFVGFVIVALMALGSCGAPRPQHVVVEDSDSTDVEQDMVARDHTIYGLCGTSTTMNTLELLTDNGDTLMLSMTNAQEARQIFGGLAVGDRLAVMTNQKRSEVTEIINLNSLLGDWVMPDPIAGSAEVGIRIKEGGGAESIEKQRICY